MLFYCKLPIVNLKNVIKLVNLKLKNLQLKTVEILSMSFSARHWNFYEDR